MNQLFDAGRWWLLAGKHWSENRKKYTLSLIAIAGLLLLWFLVILSTDSYRGIHPSMQRTTYYFGLFLAGCLYASILFTDLSSKTRGLNYLVVPASQLEKLLCTLFYGVGVFFVCYTAIFYVVDIIVIKIANSMAYSHWLKDHMAGDVFQPQNMFNIFYPKGERHSDPDFLLYILLFFFVLQAAFIYGSIYFSKFSLIKTIISLLLIGLFFTFIIGKVITGILPPGSYHNGITSYVTYTVKKTASGDGIMIYSDAASDKLVSIPAWIGDVLLFLLKYAFAPLLWLATYFRLKEKEI